MSGWRPELPEFIDKQRAPEKQERQKQEVRLLQQQANWDAWFLQRLREELFRQDDDAVLKPLLTAIDRALGQKRDDICNDYKAKFATQDARIRELEQKLALAQQFADLARDLDARQIARDECQARIRNDPAN